jgi:multicomponent Na+:H+ antiporter subunit F
MSTVVFVVVGVVFTGAAFCALYRIVRGPTILDRMIASDMLLTTIICALGAEMIYNAHARTVPAMLVLAATGFLGSVVVARYVTRRGDS